MELGIAPQTLVKFQALKSTEISWEKSSWIRRYPPAPKSALNFEGITKGRAPVPAGVAAPTNFAQITREPVLLWNTTDDPLRRSG